MGRYYYTDTGKEGKFWFAVQPSTDPHDIFGMDETEPEDIEEEEEENYRECYKDYWTDDDEYVRKKLDEQYDLLGVPKDERKYEMDYNDIGTYVWDTLRKYYLTTEEPKPDAQGHTECGYHMGDNEPTHYPISKEKELAASRVDLGLIIYNEIKQLGYCGMNAEL